MLLPIQLKTDWARIQQRKQDIINVNNKKENLKKIEHKYRVGEKVLLEKPELISKLSANVRDHIGLLRPMLMVQFAFNAVLSMNV
jgi:hypothetical protein